MRTKKLEIITCPNCGAEYLPAEIYLPNYLLGRPRDIEKDFSGKLLDFNGESMNLHESFTCDKCRKPFKVYGRVQFTTVSDSDNDFSEDYCTEIPSKLTFDED